MPLTPLKEGLLPAFARTIARPILQSPKGFPTVRFLTHHFHVDLYITFVMAQVNGPKGPIITNVIIALASAITYVRLEYETKYGINLGGLNG